MVAMLLVDMIEAIGCEVVAVASRLEDALQKAQRLSFDLAILDINLEGANTFHVAELLAKRGIGFVFATGYGNAHLPAHLTNAPVLQKRPTGSGLSPAQWQAPAGPVGRMPIRANARAQ